MIQYFRYLLLQIQPPQKLMSEAKLKGDFSLTDSVTWQSGQFFCRCDWGALMGLWTPGNWSYKVQHSLTSTSPGSSGALVGALCLLHVPAHPPHWQLHSIVVPGYRTVGVAQPIKS